MVTWIAGDKITAAKLNAMQSDFVSNVEGSYTSYKYVWTKNYQATFAGSINIINVSNTGSVVFKDSNSAATIYKVTYAGVQSSTTGFGSSAYEITEYFCRSVLGTYYGFIHDDTTATTFKIYKNDALIQTRDITDDDASITDASQIWFSPNGQYFAVVATDTGDDASWETLILYEADI